MNYSFVYCDLNNGLKVCYSGHGLINGLLKVRNLNVQYEDPHCILKSADQIFERAAMPFPCNVIKLRIVENELIEGIKQLQ